jgi:hypothetical protein
MARRSFAHRTETFGFDSTTPWALDSFRLLFAVPRAYAPLVDAWDERHPGTKRSLRKLVEMGFVEHQPAVIVDTRTGMLAASPSAPLERFRTTAKGHRLHQAYSEDIRVLRDTFPHLAVGSEKKLAKLISALDLQDSHARFGLSIPRATELSGMAERSGRWWVRHLVRNGYLRQLPFKLADTREVVPAHWRVTRLLSRQLAEVIDAFPRTASATLKVEFRLSRSRYLGDIDPSRVGISGATDFDHDVQAQLVLAAFLRSDHLASASTFTLEPRITLPIEIGTSPRRFDERGGDVVFYQPDAELRERHGGSVYRSVLEYERFQSRRDGWKHIECFLGWLHVKSLPFEPAVLRFVVDTDSRVRSYVQLIEAFADWCLDHPDRVPANKVTLAVTSLERLLDAEDPLDDGVWYRIALPSRADTEPRPALHASGNSPYAQYFGRTTDGGL